jgi:hypothetical protein
MLNRFQAEQIVAACTFEEALTLYNRLLNTSDTACRAFNALLSQYPRGPMNLTPDYVQALPQYQTLKRQCDLAGEQSRVFAAAFTKRFKKEYRAHIIAQREAKLKARQQEGV